jgi:hypothetical protein
LNVHNFTGHWGGACKDAAECHGGKYGGHMAYATYAVRADSDMSALPHAFKDWVGIAALAPKWASRNLEEFHWNLTGI